MSTLLHVRSAFSLLQSTLSIPNIIEKAKLYGYTSVGLCDVSVMHGSVAFQQACEQAGMKPIFGMEVSLSYHGEEVTLLLYAKNDDGYQSLMSLSTHISLSDEQMKIDELVPFAKDLIIVTSGDRDKLDEWMNAQDEEAILFYLSYLKDHFHDVRVGITRNDTSLRMKRNIMLKQIAKDLSLRTLSYSSSFYSDEEDEEAYRVVCAIEQGVTLDSPTLNFQTSRYIRTNEEMQQLYDIADLKEADNLADECNVNFEFPKATLPTFKNNLELPSNEFLQKLCIKGLQKRMDFKEIPLVYKERLFYELDVINSMGYADYFLIVWDFIRYAKTQDIYVGPGRGSAAGSLVAYCLGITHVDPIEYDLLFERFLNPERISMPDIDTDFADNRRDEVISYVKELYGVDRVAHIVTFNTLGSKQVIRDVGRVMGVMPSRIDLLARQVPRKLNITLQESYEDSAAFKNTINSSTEMKKLFQICLKLEGLPRHRSMHAAGVVLSERAIVEVCPLIELESDVYTTQYSMEYLEDLGLIKMDFLGLRNLTIIDDVVQMIKHSLEKDFDIMRIPLNDKKTFDLIQRVETVGVFQLESEGMKSLIKKMQPYQFEDIVATIALFRPGPMENIPTYLQRREHPEQVQYPHKDLIHILKPTYGIMIYQEQIMQVTQVMAGFSLGKADVLRKAISKKHGEELSQLRQDFIDGAIGKGYTEELAITMYDLIMKFANYGFNRSHSVAYGLVSYQMAYLKANYPLYFFVALLNSVIGSEGKTAEYIFEARKLNIIVRLPNINIASTEFVIHDGALYYPLLGIKGIGKVASQTIIDDRNNNGIYTDFFHFVARMGVIKVTQKMIETLIRAGALDVFNENRASMLATLPHAIRYANIVKVETEDQTSIDFSLVDKPMMIEVADNASTNSEEEYKAFGLYLSEHPIARLRASISNKLPTLFQLNNYKGQVKFLCQVERIKLHKTKHGDTMMFVVGSDESAKIDLVCMPNIYSQFSEVVNKGIYLLVDGKIDKPMSCLVRNLRVIETNID